MGSILRSRVIWLLLLTTLTWAVPGQAAWTEPPHLRSPFPPKSDDSLWDDQFGLPSVDGSIYCAVRFGDDLVVGGTFRQIGGVFAKNIARWDGHVWHALGNGLDYEVSCLAVYHGDLFAGGRFQFVEGTFSPHLARWNGAAWSAV